MPPFFLPSSCLLQDLLALHIPCSQIALVTHCWSHLFPCLPPQLDHEFFKGKEYDFHSSFPRAYQTVSYITKTRWIYAQLHEQSQNNEKNHCYWSMKRGKQGVAARDKARKIGCGKIMLQPYMLCWRIWTCPIGIRQAVAVSVARELTWSALIFRRISCLQFFIHFQNTC